MKNDRRDWCYIVSGVILMGIALSWFLEPNHIVIGGATGLAIIIQDVSKRVLGYGIPLWMTNLAVNIPLFIGAVKIMGFPFLKRTVVATLLLSAVLGLTEGAVELEMDYVLSSVFGGVLSGVGIGLIFRGSATTGGSDLLASLIHRRYKGVSVAKIMFVIDVVIILMGLFVFGTMATLYAVIAVFLISHTIDMVLEGLDFAKAAFIMSEYPDELAKCIMQELDRGATLLYGKGMYTGKDKPVIMVVMAKKQVLKLKEITKEIDENAFIIVTDVREVLGEF